MTRTIRIELPKTVSLNSADLQTILASQLFNLGKVTPDQAAEIAGMTVEEFLETVGQSVTQGGHGARSLS